MTRKEFGFRESCTDDDLSAIVDDIGLTQMLAVFPYSEIATPYVSRVVGDADQQASDGSVALLYSLRINPLRGDHLWFRYEYKNATTNNSGNLAVAYRIYDASEETLYTEIVKSHTQQTSQTKVVDVLDLSNVTTYGDLSGRPVTVKIYAYWPSQEEWFDAINMGGDICNVTGLLSVVMRNNDGAIYFVGNSGSYYFWDQDHAFNSFSPKRDENPPTYNRSSFCTYHSNYGLMYLGDGGLTPGVRSRRIANDVDHYTSGSPASDGEDYQTPTGLDANADTGYDTAVCRDGNIIRGVKSTVSTDTGAPATRATIEETQFSDLDDPSPSWSGSAVEVLDDGGGNTYIPNSDGTHPDGAGLTAEIWDCYVIDHWPEDTYPFGGAGVHYFCRYEWQGHANKSGGVIYQKSGNAFEYLDDLDSFHDNSPTTYPEYGPISPAVKYRAHAPSIAVWEHVKNATDDHDLNLRILRRPGHSFGTTGLWTWETVRSITTLSDTAVTDTWLWDAGLTGSKGDGTIQGAPKVELAYDREGGQHLIWTEYVSADAPYWHVYYAYKGPTSSTWTTPKKISLGTAWSTFISSGQPTKIWNIAIVKDNGFVPWPGHDLRVAWTGRDWVNTSRLFVTGVQVARNEDDISIYAPEVFMNDRDDTAGPEDMLW